MASLVIRRSSFLPVAVPAVVYVTGVLFVAALAAVTETSWIPVLYALGGATALMAWGMHAWQDRMARYVSFGAVLLLVCAINRGLYCIDYLLSGPRFDEWPFYVHSPELAVLKAEGMTVLGTLLTVAVWSRVGGGAISPSIILDRNVIKPGAWIVAYMMSLIALLAEVTLPALQGRLGQLVPSLLAIGLIVSCLLPLTQLRTRISRLALVVLLSAPFIAIASGTGMKENIILSLLPLALILWLSFKGIAARLTVVIAGVLTLGLITSYVNFYRAEVWQTKQEGVSTEKVLGQFASEMKGDGAGNESVTGISQLLGRNNASWHRGWAVSIADEQGYLPGLVFSPLLYVFIPRVLWPEKPLIQQGWQFSGVVFGAQYTAWSSSSTAAGLYPALYLGAGWIGVMLGAIMVGAFLALMTKMAFKFGGRLGGTLYLFSMLPFILRLDETWTVGALAGPVISMVYVVLIARVVTRTAHLFRHRLALRH